jgi:hypothetical protein
MAQPVGFIGCARGQAAAFSHTAHARPDRRRKMSFQPLSLVEPSCGTPKLIPLLVEVVMVAISSVDHTICIVPRWCGTWPAFAKRYSAHLGCNPFVP